MQSKIKSATEIVLRPDEVSFRKADRFAYFIGIDFSQGDKQL